ncbi:class I SAM-dependent methyltransferase [Enterococcus sp. AZ109]|uniref:class I SAM-dependent methyltransferase n=1 Tax=Enterococcus sp. AZ109 TaxID=2774634 RepID=UPI003F23CFDC
MSDMYKQFAFDYDEFGSIETYLGDEAHFFDQLFKQHGVQKVLDCACGTGQHLYMLAQLGYQVQGSDYSQSMLEVAAKNLQDKELSISLRQCDFR